MINLIIAILATTFAVLNNKKLALYYDGIIEVIPTYKYDKLYGAIICSFPPFNMITLPFSFLFLKLSNVKILTKLNKILLYFAFSPVFLIAAISFAIGNIILIPFAYIFTNFVNIQMIFHSEKHVLKTIS